MRNQNVIELFDLIHVGTEVDIAMKAILPRTIHLNRFGLKAFQFCGPSGSNLQKMHLSEPTVQPNTKVLLARKGGERKK
jgi:hypothetical protein